MIEIYVDGSCRGNPGPGGWGAIVIREDGTLFATSGQFPQTTNNRMEMTAILWALKAFGDQKPPPIVWSDSAYSVNTFNNWMWNWKNNNWKRAKNQSIENLDLILAYDKLIQNGYLIDLRKIAGHAGVRYNELADALATGKITPEEVITLG